MLLFASSQVHLWLDGGRGVGVGLAISAALFNVLLELDHDLTPTMSLSRTKGILTNS